MTTIITANLGQIDSIEGIPRQSVDCDFNYYNDHNLPFPLPNLDNRLKSKYIKIQTHKFLNEYDTLIWIDGRVKVISKTFVQEFVLGLETHDMVMFKHPARDNVQDEMTYILDNMKKGNHYLLSRYGNQQLDKELQFYKDEQLPKSAPLYACTVFARRVDERTNEFFDQWWEKCIQFSNFDQTMFAYLAWKNNIKIQALDMGKWIKQLKINKHLV